MALVAADDAARDHFEATGLCQAAVFAVKQLGLTHVSAFLRALAEERAAVRQIQRKRRDGASGQTRRGEEKARGKHHVIQMVLLLPIFTTPSQSTKEPKALLLSRRNTNRDETVRSTQNRR